MEKDCCEDGCDCCEAPPSCGGCILGEWDLECRVAVVVGVDIQRYR